MRSVRLPFWLRIGLLVAVLVLATGGGLFGYRYYTRAVTLTVAVGSIDGEASKAMSAIASHLASTNAPVRFKVTDTGTALGAAQAFASGKVDLAVVRGDVGDLSQAGAVVIVAHVVALIIATRFIHGQHGSPEGSCNRCDWRGGERKTCRRAEQGIWPGPHESLQGRGYFRCPACASVKGS
jgi:hypothetical protein